MLTARNEFETIPAFEVITGSNQGGYTPRQMAFDVISAIDTVTGLIDTTSDWKDLAGMSDDDTQEINDLIEEYVDHLNYYAPIPDSCSISWHDNELIVMPYIDDENEKFDEVPESFVDDVIYQVSDHGNVTCYRWERISRLQGKYVEIWSMV
jgi:hypothetical protein